MTPPHRRQCLAGGHRQIKGPGEPATPPRPPHTLLTLLDPACCSFGSVETASPKGVCCPDIAAVTVPPGGRYKNGRDAAAWCRGNEQVMVESSASADERARRKSRSARESRGKEERDKIGGRGGVDRKDASLRRALSTRRLYGDTDGQEARRRMLLRTAKIVLPRLSVLLVPSSDRRAAPPTGPIRPRPRLEMPFPASGSRHLFSPP